MGLFLTLLELSFTECESYTEIMLQVDMKLEIQRVNQKINKLEELMTNFLEQISRNNLQVATPPTPQVEREI